MCLYVHSVFIHTSISTFFTLFCCISFGYPMSKEPNQQSEESEPSAKAGRKGIPKKAPELTKAQAKRAKLVKQLEEGGKPEQLARLLVEKDKLQANLVTLLLEPEFDPEKVKLQQERLEAIKLIISDLSVPESTANSEDASSEMGESKKNKKSKKRERERKEQEEALSQSLTDLSVKGSEGVADETSSEAERKARSVRVNMNKFNSLPKLSAKGGDDVMEVHKLLSHVFNIVDGLKCSNEYLGAVKVSIASHESLSQHLRTKAVELMKH